MDENPEMFLTAGKLVHFTTGEYSDYSLFGDFVALDNLTIGDARHIAGEIREKESQAEAKAGWYDGDVHTDFIAELTRRGLLLSVDSMERHIGSYGELSLDA
jgi:hypothetical protein